MKYLSKNNILNLLILTLFSHSFVVVNASPNVDQNAIVVITSNHTPLIHIDNLRQLLVQHNRSLIIHNLDAIHAFKTTMSKGLPSNKYLATTAFQKRLQKMGKANFNKQLLQAYQGLLFAMRYQIERYPAVVFNTRHVIYGESNLTIAWQKYQQWQRQHTTNNRNPQVSDDHD